MKNHLHIFCLAGFAILLPGFGSRASTVGATTPFTSYEAEAGALGGGATVISLTAPPTTQYSSPQLEASGHAFVQLTNIGEYVAWTNTTGANITAINLRSCIPDAPAGGGITSTIDFYVNGVFRQAFAVNSQQNYCYEGTNYNGQADKNPADGDPRGFWNDTHAFVAGAPIMPGDIFSFQEDSTNTAAFYDIDVIDVENPPPAITQPNGSLSILTYGAVSNSITTDNTSAINNCFSSARTLGKVAWIPAGTYYFSGINGGLNAAGITIQGAGPWYSTLYRVVAATNTQGVANIITTTSSTLQNLSLDCNGFSRANNNNNGAVNFSGTNWLVDNVWIQHATSAFWCAGVNGTARNCRVLSVWSDGGNFNNVQSDDGIGMNLTYSNNFVRGTGDDAMAINSVNYNVYGNTTNYYTIMSNIVYADNTSVGAWGGKNLSLYGGINIVATNNLLHDNARYTGLGVGKFGVNGSDLLLATVTGNTVLRCGGNGYNQQQQAMMIGNAGDGQGVGTVANAYCASNTILNALYSGVGFSSSTNILFQRNTIINPGLDGMAIGAPDLGSGVVGSAIINSNTVTGLNSGRNAYTNSAYAYAGVIPTAAANYSSASGVQTETCAEGGQDLTGLNPGDWAAYNNVSFTGINTFVARVASTNSGGSIQIYLDSTSGTLIGTCAVPNTGGAQTYANAYCNISGAGGIHNVYLVFSGSGGGNLLNMEFQGFFSAPPALSHQLVVGNIYSLKSLTNGEYVTAANGGASALIAQSATVGAAQEFQIIDAGNGNIGFESLVNSNIVTADNAGGSPLIANRTAVGSWETFTEVDAGNGNIGLRAMANNKYVTAPNGGASSLIASSTFVGTAESFTVGFVSGYPPPAPGGLTATPGNSQVVLNWAVAPGATGYNVAAAATSGGTYTVIANNVTGLSYTNTGLANGSTYYFEVSALNPAGQSTNSAPVSAIAGSLNRTGWQVSASSTESGGSPNNAIDGNIATRWSTGADQVNGQWFEVDMGATNTFYELILDAAASGNDYPRDYRVNVSNDGVNWGNAVATGAGSTALTKITFPSQTARYILVTQTGSAPANFWSIYEFNVLGTTVSLTPPQLITAIGGGQIQLGWPQDHTGWVLQVQTNPPDAGLSANWTTLPASAGTNLMTFPIAPANGSVFFRLVYP